MIRSEQRAGDLASLTFCNNSADIAAEECGYAMRLEGTTLLIAPDPFGGRTVEIDIDAREIGSQSFSSAAEARHVVAAWQPLTARAESAPSWCAVPPSSFSSS